MDETSLVRSLGPYFDWMLIAFSAVLSGLVYRYRHQRWAQILTRDIVLKQRPGEAYWEYQRRRGNRCLVIAAICIGFTVLAGYRFASHDPSAPLWEMLLVMFGVVFSYRAILAAVEAFRISRQTR